jgi:hypothetical protein
MAYTSDDLIALKNAINQIGFEDKDQKTLMDRFREVRDDESLNQLHEEWKKFWKKRSLELHPDKGGNEDDFKQFGEKKEIIDGFFDKYTINEEKLGVQKRKFIDEQHKRNFFIIRDHVANTPSSSQSSSSSRDRYPTYWSQTGFEKQDGQYFGPRRASFGGTRSSGSFSSRDTRKDQNNFADLNELLREFLERISKPSSDRSPHKDDLNSKQNNGNNENQTKSSSNYSNKNASGQDSSKTNYQSNKEADPSQNRSKQFEGKSGSFHNPTLVFCFTAQGDGIIFIAQQNQRRSEKENHNGPLTFASRFGGVNNENTKKGSSRY